MTSMPRITKAMMMTPRMLGMMTVQKIRQLLAPSTVAARTGFSGTALRPESRIRKNSGDQCQTSVMTTAKKASTPWLSHCRSAPAEVPPIQPST